ncbi:hypothetical protein ACWGIN_03100 [Streptomyces sp. NPDC054861]
MPQNRRGILGAALALPAALTVGSLAAASPAAAAPAGAEAGEWTDLVLEPGITPQAGATPQVRILTLAGTAYLQARGLISCNLTADARIATLPAGLTPTWYARATAPRNNHQGVNACRFEVNPSGAVSVYGATATSPITWVQLDSVQTVWR